MGSGDYTYADLPDLKGRKILITGANSGFGFEAAKAFILNSNCDLVILACRSKEKADDAAKKIVCAAEAVKGKKLPNGLEPSTVPPKDRMEVLVLDLGDLEQIPKAAEELRNRHKSLDILLNNAGVGGIWKKLVTKQGHELQFGTNHLGHFKFTSHVMDLLKSSEFKPARIVSVASMVHEFSKGLDFTDLDWERRKFKGMASYSDSKLANVLFMNGLKNRLEAAGLGSAITVVAMHPGWASTDIARHSFALRWISKMGGASPEKVAINEVRAAVDPTMKSGDYTNPKRWKMYGPPVKAEISKVAQLPEQIDGLWEHTERILKEPFKL